MSSINETYISLLTDVMKKKENILEELILATMKQHGCFRDGIFDEETYEDQFNFKMAKLKSLEELDEGFTSLYERVREELQTNKEAYKTQILALQQCIRDITDKSIRVKQLEAENKLLLDGYLNKEKKKIKDYKVSKKTASVYYKNMMKQFNSEGIFYNETN